MREADRSDVDVDVVEREGERKGGWREGERERGEERREREEGRGAREGRGWPMRASPPPSPFTARVRGLQTLELRVQDLRFRVQVIRA